MDRRLASPFRFLLKPVMTGVNGAYITDVVFNTNSEYEVKGGYMPRKGKNFRHGYVEGILRRILRLNHARETIKIGDGQIHTYLIQDDGNITQIMLDKNEDITVLNPGNSIKLPDPKNPMLIVTNVSKGNTGSNVLKSPPTLNETNIGKRKVIQFPTRNRNF